MNPLRARFIQQLQIEGASPHTITNYVNCIADLARFHNRSPLNMTVDDIRAYLSHLVVDRKLEAATVNQTFYSLKRFYRIMEPDNKVMNHFCKMKEPKRVPEVLSRQEVERLIDAVENQKHKAAVMLLYCGGLRLSECVKLLPQHIESDRMKIRVEQGKGKKDRYTLLSKRALEHVRSYYRLYRPEKWLFEGRNKKHLSTRMLQKIISDGAKTAGIKKRVHPHLLRHSFATHLLEAGVALQVIQYLLGHESIKTTTIYTHISQAMVDKVVNPLDMEISTTQGSDRGDINA